MLQFRRGKGLMWCAERVDGDAAAAAATTTGEVGIILALFIKMLTQCVAFNNSYLHTRDSCK